MAEYKRAWYLRNSDHQKAQVKVNQERSIRENQARAWQYLAAHPCVDCGESDPVVLQFDHLRDKRTEISKMLRRGFTWTTIELEIAKCDVRCASCHRRRTAMERGYYRAKGVCWVSDVITAYGVGTTDNC